MRALDLSSPRFRRDLALRAPRGSEPYRALMLVLRDLASAEALPGPEDVVVVLPMQVMARPIPGTNLVVPYIAGPDVLRPIAVLERS